MNLSPVLPAQATPRKPKRVRRYVVAYQCPACKASAYVDDFDGEQELQCACGQAICISLTEGIPPDWHYEF